MARTTRPRARRAAGTGNVFFDAKKARWRAQFTDAHGKSRYLSDKSEQAVTAKLDRAIAERDHGTLGLAPKSTPTLGEWLGIWLECKYDVKPKTIARYRLDIDRYIQPNIGGLHLDQVKPTHIEWLSARLKTENGLAPSSVKRVHATLSSALNDAYRSEVVTTRVMDRVRAPRVPVVKREIIPEAAVHALLTEAARQGTMVHCRWHLALVWGLRQGEVLGLR